MHARMQCLDAAIEALGELGEVGDGGDRHSRLLDVRRGRAGGHDLDSGSVEGCHESGEAGLVVHRDEGAPDGSTG